LGETEGLVIDLGGNISGGLGSLPVMSSLCADRRPIGYNVTRKASISRCSTATVRLPFSRRVSGSVGSTVAFAMLINEHTKSAAEMIGDFASTNQLATLVGTRTAGEVLGAVSFLVGEGYHLRIPIGGWMTSNDRLLDGSGVSPHVEASPSMTALRAGQDVTLERATEVF
jgi:C-terminal processing protease CtpA/Prc